MDTPDKNRISAVSFFNFEDSPVFQYINSLSPIESDHVFHSLPLASPSSLFSSPQIESSSRDSRFSIKRHRSLDLSSPVLVSLGENETVQDGLVQLKRSKPEEEMANVSETKPFKEEQVKLAIELASSLRNGEKRGCDNQLVSSDEVVPMDAVNEIASVGEQPDYDSYVVFQISQEMEAEIGSCEQEIPRIPQQFSILCSNSGDVVESCSVQVASGDLDTSLSSSSHTVDVDAEDEEETVLQVCRKQRSVRRRCLTFDLGGSHKRVPLRDSTNDLPLGFTSINTASSEILTIPLTIGLHLNGLVNPSVSSYGNKLTSKGGPVLSHGEDEFTTPVSTTRDLVSCDNQIMEESSERSMEGEWVEELGSCKRCRCKKSKCLKLYCDCFAAGLYCVESCSCQNCFNRPIHEDIVMKTRRGVEARNPLAFAPKVILTSGSATFLGEENNKTPASARHMRGCNCKRSGCSKKYCECYLMGVGCSASCRCIGCKNVLCHTNEQFQFP